ncbi:putative NAD(P)-binding domain-containing protein [Rosa chinensis]|uniref:Putative NAD(P)-binding domain-containing protein n=1 Tax=Rosa chinensis TaxID=74649 RepID=A0A2P6Q4R4_ROSCH|nr:putative NAD(P)-binding domain-containing protein [Rosa chinensis]
MSFIFSMVFWVQKHTVIESKPEHFLDDLRLNNPWPELRRYRELIKTRMTADDVDNYSEALRTPLKSLLLEELEFLANEGGGEAPLEGSVPDMTSSTEHYVALQKTYQAKAEADFLVLTKGLGLF